jgi:hypothetical protein
VWAGWWRWHRRTLGRPSRSDGRWTPTWCGGPPAAGGHPGAGDWGEQHQPARGQPGAEDVRVRGEDRVRGSERRYGQRDSRAGGGDGRGQRRVGDACEDRRAGDQPAARPLVQRGRLQRAEPDGPRGWTCISPVYWQVTIRTPSSVPRTGAVGSRGLAGSQASGSQARRYMASTWKSGAGTPCTLLPIPERWPLTMPGS